MKQLMTTNFLSDEAIIKLFYSSNPDDWRLAAMYTVHKYPWKEHIVEFFEKINFNYKKKWGNRPSYVYVSKENFVQIIVGSYGVYCKTLLSPVEIKYNNIIEYI